MAFTVKELQGSNPEQNGVWEKKKKKIFKVEAALCHLLEVLPSFQCFKIIKVDYAEDQLMSAIA